MESFEDFTQECSNDVLGLTLFFYMAKSNLPSAFHMGRVHAFCEDFGAKANKYILTGEHRNSFMH